MAQANQLRRTIATGTYTAVLVLVIVSGTLTAALVVVERRFARHA